MKAFASRIAPSGHVVLVRLPDSGRFLGLFADDQSVRDLTPNVADLLLAGALDALEVADSARPEPAETVQAVEVTYVEDAATLGQVHEQASFTWAHLPTGEAGDFPAGNVLALVVRGVAVELTAAVATEAADVPDTAEGAEPGEGPEGAHVPTSDEA